MDLIRNKDGSTPPLSKCLNCGSPCYGEFCDEKCSSEYISYLEEDIYGGLGFLSNSF